MDAETEKHIWATFDSIFKTLARQGKKLDEMERRLADAEKQNAELVATIGRKGINVQDVLADPDSAFTNIFEEGQNNG